jgi:hypothetical protein
LNSRTFSIDAAWSAKVPQQRDLRVGKGFDHIAPDADRADRLPCREHGAEHDLAPREPGADE